MKHAALAIAASLALSACGGAGAPDTAEPAADAAAAESMSEAGIPEAVAALWSGNWTASDPETGQTIARFELRAENDRWGGQYTLTQNFCQSDQPEYTASLCPFAGQGGSWYEVDANTVSLIATAPDPFLPGEDFTLTLTSTDQATVSNVVFVADAGRVSFDAEFERVQ